MNYLKIKNTGVIEAEDLMLLGSSTKRGDDTQIGMFGTGLKLGTPYLLRNEIDFRIFAGLKEINVSTEVVLHRNTPVQVMTVNGEKTSITTQAGLKWTAWMALREIVANAIDGGNYEITTIFNPEKFKGDDVDSTVFYIAMNKDLANVMMNFDKYFTFGKEADYVTEKGDKFYLKQEQSRVNIYRKGIRCLDSARKTLLDIDFYEADISDDRIISESHMDNKIARIVQSEDLPLNIFLALMKSEYKDWLPYRINSLLTTKLLELLNSGYTFTCGYLIALGDLISNPNSTKDTCIMIPNRWHSQLTEQGHIESPFSSLTTASAVPDDFIETREINIYPIKEILKKVGLDTVNISSGIWKTCSIDAFTHNGTYYIKDTAELSNVEIASLICTLQTELSWSIVLTGNIKSR